MNRDLRQYARQTTVRLIAGVLGILFTVGLGLIYLLYGREAAIIGLVCLLGGLSPLALIAGLLLGMDWVVKRANKE